MMKRKIKVFAMGGTISAHHEDRLNLSDYESGYYSGEEIAQAIPEINDIAEVHIEQLTNVSSTLITSNHWLDLRKQINQSLNEEGFDGVVITHGTNTLEETAYFLHLTVNTEKPVILTGAQRPLTALSSDAHLNLYNAVKVASADTAYGKGVLVVLNDQINCARDVTKTNTYQLESFQSGELGCLGFVEPDNTVQFYRSPARKHTTHSVFSTIKDKALPHVEIVYSYAGAGGNIIRSLSSSGDVDGIIIAGTGGGRCSYKEEKAASEAQKKGIQIVMGSRCAHGRVVPLEKYDHLGAPTADNLSPQKARILLMIALSKFQEHTQLQEVFNTY